MEALEKYCSDSLCGIGIPGIIGFKFDREGKDKEDAINSALSDIEKSIPGYTVLEISGTILGE